MIKKDSLSSLMNRAAQPSEARTVQADISPIVEPVAAAIPEPLPTSTETADKPVNKAVELTEEDLYDTTETVLMMGDFAQRGALTLWAKSKKKDRFLRLYGKEWEKVFDTNKAAYKAGQTSDMSPAVLAMMTHADDIEEIIESLPFTDEEKEMLHKPLSKMLKQHGGVMPPEWVLYMSIGRIFGGRIWDVASL